MASGHTVDFTIERLPERLKQQLCPILSPSVPQREWLHVNEVYSGDAQQLLPRIEPNSIALSVWSPPYFVGKQYESYLTFNEWKSLLRTVIKLHFPIIKPGGFVVINIADILCFKDSAIPRIQAEAIDRRRCSVTREDVLKAISEHPDYNRYKIADLLHCSEQTVDRRLHGNNIRGGKHALQTRVKIVGGLIEEWVMDAGFYLYDRRIWIKDPAWENDPWNTLSYRSIDEFEYLYFLWKPGIVKVRRSRLSGEEWGEWGTRAIWRFPSVRKNNDHEAKFPEELPRRAIRLLTDPGDIVLDCFLGSGTTALAAIKERRQFIGIELQDKYVTLARSQIAALEKRKDVH